MISKVCYLGNVSSIHVQRWAESFAERGYEVHVISLASEKPDLPGVTIHSIEPFFRNHYLSFVLANREVQELLKEIQPDVLHAHWIPTYGMLGVLSGYSPLVVSAWGGDVMRAPFWEQNRSLKGKLTSPLFWCLDKFVLSKAAVATTTSHVMRQLIAKSFAVPESRLATFPWGVDQRIFLSPPPERIAAWRQELNLPKNSPIVLYNREIHPAYRTETLVRSLPQIIKEVPETLAVFLGGYSDQAYAVEMKELVKTLGVTDHVRFINKLLTPSDVAAVLHLSDVFVSIPLRDNRSAAVLEGMLCGVTPILSNIPANRELVDDKKNGFLVTGDDHDELAIAVIEAILGRDTLRHSMGSANREYVLRDASWEASMERMESLYKRVISEGG